MKTLKAPRKCLRQSAVSLPALLILGALSGSAIAATDIGSPCAEATSSSDVLHAFIARDSEAAIAQTVDATETLTSDSLVDNSDQPSTEVDKASDSEKSVEDTTNPELTTRLPGVSVNDLPGFRRHMYRTDI